MSRLAAEMAARSLEEEQAQQIKTADPKDLPKAAVVDPEAVQTKGPLKPAVEPGGPIKAQGVNEIISVVPNTVEQGTTGLLVTFTLDTDTPPPPPGGTAPDCRF